MPARRWTIKLVDNVMAWGDSCRMVVDGPPLDGTPVEVMEAAPKAGGALCSCDDRSDFTWMVARALLRATGFSSWGAGAWIHEQDEGTVMELEDALRYAVQLSREGYVRSGAR